MLESILFPIILLTSGFIILFDVAKYQIINESDDGINGIYSLDFFGPKLAFLMNIIPIIPEVVMIFMLPFWAIYGALKGVSKITKYVDKEWKKIEDKEWKKIEKK